MNARLRKSEILKDKKAISRLFEKGEWNKGRYVNIVSLPAEKRQILFTVARHVKGAVIRNRGKRYLRETYRRNKDHFSPERIYGLIIKRFPESDSLCGIESDIRIQLQHD
ncbi:MAG: ribonuclease P protein component [Candidatus Marinimicrobia bacterium]|jgi:ribonuclease P protein component|nr:ribonuclease P protein component [Candidatus Neomarinimicrobiota bacterium]MDD5709609.1 ribonuclease P protein component [Candidatus Neomarinimicrobiota bacterium]MDX9777915.1 ribonuclease P protein component [bacterium]